MHYGAARRAHDPCVMNDRPNCGKDLLSSEHTPIPACHLVNPLSAAMNLVPRVRRRNRTIELGRTDRSEAYRAEHLGPRRYALAAHIIAQAKLRCWTLYSSISACLAFDKLRKPVIGFLWQALERPEIDVDYAETAAVAFRPFKIVE